MNPTHLSRIACLLSLLLVLGGCAWAGATYVESEAELQRLVEAGVQVEPIKDQAAPGRTTAPEAVELYYYLFKPLGKPDAVVDWKYHYVIAPATSPDYRTREFAKLTVFLPDRNDAVALRKLREEAGRLGADAIVNLIRIPQTSDVVVQSYPYTARKIWGYSYAGTAVVRKAN